MKVKVLSILAALTLFAACENPFVSDILPDRDGYTVTFDKNGGTTEASPRTKTVTPPATTVGTLPAPPMRTNYTFAGWNTRADGTGSAFTASTVVTANITVYAKWTPGETATSVKVDFENDALGATTKYTFTSGSSAPAVAVVADPVNNGQKSLQIASTDYNQAAIIPIKLPAVLNTATSFTFRICLTDGTLSYKKVLVYIAGDDDTFVQYAFGNPAGDSNQFAANKLGETAEIPSLTLNQWKDYEIPITGASLNSAIANLTGNVYLAIGINHSDTEGITYLLDDLTFAFKGGQPPADFPTLVTFEGDLVGDTYEYTSGDNSPDSAVAVDPVNASQKSLRVATNAGGDNKSAWNQAAIIPINLPDPLNTYKSFRFRFKLQTAGTLLDNGQPRKINVYVADDPAKFKRYAFGNPANHSNQDQQFANLLLGEVEPDYGVIHWVDYAVNFNSPNAAINNLSGNVYVAIGINHDTAVTYYLDDLSFFKQELQKQPGAALTGTFSVVDGSLSASGVEIDASVTLPSGSTQTIEYSVSPTATGSPGVWQPGLIFTGLESETIYTAYARSAANALYNAGEPTSSEALFTTLGKALGAAVSGTFSATDIKHNRVTLNVSSLVLSPTTTGQIIEYAVSETNTAPTTEDKWQTVTTFSGLQKTTTYYAFARSKENDNYKAGTPIVSASFETTDVQLNQIVPAVVVNFEDDALGATTKYTVTSAPNNGTGTATIVADPDTVGRPNQKSLNMHSTGYNIGAVIPINLPFALQNYQSFTFRFKVASGNPSNPKVSVYIADAANKFTQYGFGNPSSNQNQFANLLLGEVEPNFLATEWVEYEIEIDATTLNSAIKNLSGNLYLAIGINSNTTIGLQFDDLTFNAVHDFAPPPSLSPTSATFSKGAPANIQVTMNLYGWPFLSISGGSPAITAGNYSVSGSTVTINSTYLLTQADGPLTLTFIFDDGPTPIIINITITIRSAALLTEYNFAADSPAVSTSGDLSASVTGGVLRLEKTAANHSTPYLIIPFDLGSTTLGSYSKILIEFRGVSGDYNYKTLQVEVQPNGTAPAGNTNFGSVNNHSMPSTFNGSATTVNRTGNASTSMTGQINVIISLNNTSNFVYEIKSIKLE